MHITLIFSITKYGTIRILFIAVEIIMGLIRGSEMISLKKSAIGWDVNYCSLNNNLYGAARAQRSPVENDDHSNLTSCLTFTGCHFRQNCRRA